MNRFVAAPGFVLALLAGGLSAADAPVELPPMFVEESTSSAPWLYVNVGGVEFLSRCSGSTTREFIEAWLEKMQLLHVLVPEEFLARVDVPAVCVLYGQDLKQTVSAEIQRELRGEDSRKGEKSHSDRVNIAPNMRLSDRDMHATIVYIDEALFDGASLNIAPGQVRFLLQGRVPEWPAWLVEGVESNFRRADFTLDPITLSPLVWQSQGESDELASDPTRPRALLPANELFAPATKRAMENQHPRRAQTRLGEQELFVRWAMASGEATRAAFWKFAARAAETPVTEEMFETLFGFDFAELRDRLSDFLPKAVWKDVWISPGTLAPQPRFEVERATPSQIARVRGEWERLAISYVQRRLPQVREPYIAQARRTLRRAFAAGDRDPRLLATMGLCEIDAGNEAGARKFLEPATAGGVVRPRAYYELARLRFAALRHGAAEGKLFSFTELAPILQPLQRAIAQSPPLPEAFILLGEAWACCETAPNRAELAELEMGTRFFARRPAVAYPVARAFAQHGKKSEATAALDACAGYPADDALLASIARLRTELSSALRTAAEP